MLHAPEVQVKAREELARVIGNERLPTFTDRADLPYIDAIVKETYRWEQVIPLGVPHKVTKDDVSNTIILFMRYTHSLSM